MKIGGHRIYTLIAMGMRPDGMYGSSSTPATDLKGTLYAPTLALGLHTPFEHALFDDLPADRRACDHRAPWLASPLTQDAHRRIPHR